MDKDFYFNPRAFILPPFIKCPKCGANAFGVLSIFDDSFVRRCKVCMYPKGNEQPYRQTLPQLNKKVIYLDQLAISNMMKVLNPNTRAYQQNKVEVYWRTLFEKLDKLTKIQLIVCPDSEFHSNESMLFSFTQELKSMYEHFSHGVTFFDNITIKRFQLDHSVRAWLSGADSFSPPLKRSNVIRGKINAWQERFIITINFTKSEDIVNELIAHKNQLHKGLTDVFNNWKTIANKDFMFWFENEINSYRNSVISGYINAINRAEAGDFEAYFNASVMYIEAIQTPIKESGLRDPERLWEKTLAYLESEELAKVPFIKLSASLFASIARKAANGQKRPPNQGTMNDIEMISCLLPYCDAIFIDNEFATYLRESPVSKINNFPAKVFSLNNKLDLLDYLDELEQETNAEHLTALNEVYGDSWNRPYIQMFGLN